ncbi:MAG: polysaccharide biosynthesis tyrosine autokinase [Flavobacteriales bacterium]|nr:polysaccharide biosynthesis tyrosine autokinase [Flavobacteriales bacterium]
MATSPATDIIDLRVIIRKLLSKWWWFLITCTIAGAAGVAYLKVTPKSYMVQATILMGEGGKPGFGQKEDFLKGMSLVRGSSQLEDDIAIMTSRSNIMKTLRRLDFGVAYYETHDFMTEERYDYPPFRVRLDSVAVQVAGVKIHVKVDRVAKTYSVSAEGQNVQLFNVQKQELMGDFLPEYKVEETLAIGQPFSAQNLSFRIEFPEDRVYEAGSDYYFKIVSLDQQFMNYISRLNVEPPESDGHIVSLSLTGTSTNKESVFINKLMETFIEGELYKQQQKGIKTIDFIDTQIDTVAGTLKEAENEIAQQRLTSGMPGSVGNVSDALFQERSRLEDQISIVRRKRSYCSGVVDKLRSSDDSNFPPPSGFEDPVLNNLILDITRLSADLSALRLQSGGKSNPTAVAMERRRRNLLSTLEQTAQNILTEADITLTDLSGRLGRINYSLGRMPEDSKQLGIKERKFKLSETLYNYLMEKRAEAGIAIASDEVDKVIIDEANVVGGGSVGPQKKLVLGGALFIGLLVPVLIILVRDFFNDSIADLDELKRVSSLPVLGLIPSSKRKRVLPNEPKSMLAEAFRTVRINLQYLNANVPRQVLGFTSSSSGEGKTFCAVNLAGVMALSGKRVLLIDADMRRPNVLKTMDLSDGPGLSTFLIGETDLGSIIQKSDIVGLDVIGAGPIPPNPSELAEDPRMAELFTTMRQRYDHIIVDASPIGLVSEFVVLLGYLDLSLYVVRERHTPRRALRSINEMVANGKVGRVDLLLNDVKAERAQGYGYYTK